MQIVFPRLISRSQLHNAGAKIHSQDHKPLCTRSRPERNPLCVLESIKEGHRGSDVKTVCCEWKTRPAEGFRWKSAAGRKWRKEAAPQSYAEETLLHRHTHMYQNKFTGEQVSAKNCIDTRAQNAILLKREEKVALCVCVCLYNTHTRTLHLVIISLRFIH